MDDSSALKYALGIAGTLLLIIWGMMRRESDKTEAALRDKASSASVDELKTDHATALRDVKDHFQKIIDRNHDDYKDRIRELNDRQDREVDWLKEELSKLGEGLQAMRQEQVAANSQQLAANATIMQNIQQLSIILQHGKN